MKVPCYGCKERTPECHCSCVKYKEFTKLIEMKRRMRQLERMISALSPSFERSILMREHKRKRGRKD